MQAKCLHPDAGQVRRRKMTKLALFRAPLVGATIATFLAFGLSPRALPAFAAGSVSLTQTTVPQSASVAVSGSGFTGNDNVTIFIDAPVGGQMQHIQATATTDGSGAFSTHLNLPRAIAAGTYTLTA